MIYHSEISRQELLKAIKGSHITFGGNKKLRIFGTLKCRSGRKMKKENRVFFHSKQEAIETGYRPCGHCMRSEYKVFIKTNPK